MLTGPLTSFPNRTTRVVLRAWFRFVAVLGFAGLLLQGSTGRAEPATPLAGTYRIADATDLESHGMYHFLYLHPSGRFLMAAEWAGHETSRAVGAWMLKGSDLVLEGSVDVDTNEGHWDAAFQREFRIERSTGVRADSVLRLAPVFAKNHYGMLGWPNAYVFLSAQPAPNLPHESFPSDSARLLAVIDGLIARASPPAR